MARTAASVAATGFLAIAAFQAALALGAPLGRAAWGGAHAGVLPRGLRLASACAAAAWLVAALLVLGRARYWTLLPFAVFRRGVMVLSPLLAGGAVMNVASSSPWERFFWAPAAAVLSAASLITAWAPIRAGGAGAERPTE